MDAIMKMFHKNASQVIRLVQAYKTSQNNVFLHADSFLSEDEINTMKSALPQDMQAPIRS